MSSWIRAGTVTVTNNSATVGGTGSSWIATGVQPGWIFRGPDKVAYEVLSVASDTSLTLAETYGGPSVSGAGYAIIPTEASLQAAASSVAAAAGVVSPLGANAAILALRAGLPIPADQGGTGVNNGNRTATLTKSLTVAGPGNVSLASDGNTDAIATIPSGTKHLAIAVSTSGVRVDHGYGDPTIVSCGAVGTLLAGMGTSTDPAFISPSTLRPMISGDGGGGQPLYAHDIGISVQPFGVAPRLRSYTVATLPSAAAAGELIYVSDMAGGAEPAFSSASGAAGWKKFSDKSAVS